MKEIDNIEEKKRGLLITIMTNKFEENIAELLEGGNYETMEELDQIVDQKLRRYYDECEMVKNYYDEKIYS